MGQAETIGCGQPCPPWPAVTAVVGHDRRDPPRPDEVAAEAVPGRRRLVRSFARTYRSFVRRLLRPRGNAEPTTSDRGEGCPARPTPHARVSRSCGAAFKAALKLPIQKATVQWLLAWRPSTLSTHRSRLLTARAAMACLWVSEVARLQVCDLWFDHLMSHGVPGFEGDVLGAHSLASAVAPSGGGTGPGRVRSGRPQLRGGGRPSGPFAGWGSSGERGRRPVDPRSTRTRGQWARSRDKRARPSESSRPSLSARPSVPSVNRPAVGVLTAHAELRGEAGGGAAGVLTRMARSLTLARWGTEDADGAPTDLGALGY